MRKPFSRRFNCNRAQLTNQTDQAHAVGGGSFHFKKLERGVGTLSPEELEQRGNGAGPKGVLAPLEVEFDQPRHGGGSDKGTQSRPAAFRVLEVVFRQRPAQLQADFLDRFEVFMVAGVLRQAAQATRQQAMASPILLLVIQKVLAQAPGHGTHKLESLRACDRAEQVRHPGIFLGPSLRRN